MGREHAIELRVRYDEVDPMGVVHHSRYLAWLEMGRVELMRDAGLVHLAQEERGQALTVTSVEVRYQSPARYDDRLRLVTRVEEARGARVVFRSTLTRLEPAPPAAVAEATVVAAAVGPSGRARRLSPEELAAFTGPAVP